MNDTPPVAPPRSRWRLWQISLRGLLLAMLVIAGLLGWKAQRVHRQRQIVRQIESLGGWVAFDYQLRDLRDSAGPPPSAWRTWCGKYLGENFFGQVQAVSLSGRKIQEVSFLSELPALTSVNLSGTQVSDLAP